MKEVEKTQEKPVRASKKALFPIGVKIALLLSVTIFFSISLYAALAIWKFKDDKIKYVLSSNGLLTSTVGENLDLQFDSAQSLITQILSIVKSDKLSKTESLLLEQILSSNRNLMALRIYLEYPLSQSRKLLVHVAHPEITTLTGLQVSALAALDGERLSKFPNTKMEDIVGSAKEPVVTYIRRLKTQDSQNVTFLFYLNKDFVSNSLKKADSAAELYVVGQDGNLVSASNNSFSSDAFQELYQRAKKHSFREGSFEYKASQKEFIGSFYRLQNGWYLLSHMDRDKAFSGTREIIVNAIVFAILIGSLLVAIGILFSKSITFPLRELMKVIDSIAAGNYQVRFKFKTKDEINELAEHFVMLGKKLSDREEELEKATELAIKDGMTGLYNNRYFRQRFSEFLSIYQRHKTHFSILVTDIDHFKKFNDTYGHLQGDEVLKQFAKIMKEECRDTDIVARYGGEEFAIILPETDAKGATEVAERIRKHYETHDIINLNDKSVIHSTCSIGVSCVTENDFKSIDEIIEHTDKKLYKAKKGGRNQVWNLAA